MTVELKRAKDSRQVAADALALAEGLLRLATVAIEGLERERAGIEQAYAVVLEQRPLNPEELAIIRANVAALAKARQNTGIRDGLSVFQRRVAALAAQASKESRQ